MTNDKSKISIGQKLLILVSIVPFSILAFPFVCLILSFLLNKFIPNNGIIMILAMMPFTISGYLWGMIIGIILAVIVIYKYRRC